MKGCLSKEVVSDKVEVVMGHSTFVTSKAGLTKEVVSQMRYSCTQAQVGISLVNQTPPRPPFYHYARNDKMEGGEGSGS